MNFNTVMLSAILIVVAETQYSSCMEKSAMNFRFFHRNDNIKQLHIVMNKLFLTLKLNQNFTQPVKIRVLLTMHNNLINIVKNIYKTHDGENITDNIAINDYAKPNLLDEVLDDEFVFFPENIIKLNAIIKKIIDSNLTFNFDDFVKQFVSVLHTLKVNDNNTIKKTKSKRRQLRQRRNLKVWKIPGFEENITHTNRRNLKNNKAMMIRSYPFIASVHVMEEFVCAGSIISRDLVITAASCLQVAYIHRNEKSPRNEIFVRVGSDNSIQGGMIINVSYVHFHPLYDPETLNNNLAILNLDRPIHFSKAGIVRRILYDKSSTAFPGYVDELLVLGWKLNYSLRLENERRHLNQAYLGLYPTKDCAAAYSIYYVSDSNICARFAHKERGACTDQGDPAIVSNILVGVVSFRPTSCGSPGSVTVFTRLGVYASWIDSIVKLSSRKMQKRMLSSKQVKRTSTKNQKHRGSYGHLSYNYDYPEEVFILKEILKDIATKNDPMIEKIIDEGFNKELVDFVETTTKLDVLHSPLLNKSYILYPSLHIPGNKYYKPQSKTTLPWTFDSIAIALGIMPPVITSKSVPPPPPPLTTKTTLQRIYQGGKVIPRMASRVTKPIFDNEEYDAIDIYYEGKNYEANYNSKVTTRKNIYKQTTSRLIFSDESNSKPDYHLTKTTKADNFEDYRNIFFHLEGNIDVHGPKLNLKQGQTVEEESFAEEDYSNEEQTSESGDEFSSSSELKL